MSENTAVEAGWVVTKPQTITAPGFVVGTVLHVDETDEGKPFAWVIGKREWESPWSLIGCTASSVEPWMGGEIPGGTPGIPEIGKALVDRHRLMQEQAEARSQRLREMEAEREDFQEKVRDMAIEKAQELGWCKPGLNEALKELGLRPTVQDYKVPVQISQTVYVTVEAESEEDAVREVDDEWTGHMLAREADDYDWHIEIDEHNVTVAD